MEVDLYPKNDPARADEVDGAIGDQSIFEATFGYYGHGVGPETASPPSGWQTRLVRVEIQSRIPAVRPIAWCLEPHDLVLAKLARGIERDWDYARVAVDAGVVKLETLLERVESLPLEVERGRHIAASLRTFGDTT